MSNMLPQNQMLQQNKILQEAIDYLSQGQMEPLQKMPLLLQKLTEEDWKQVYSLILQLEDEKLLSTLH